MFAPDFPIVVAIPNTTTNRVLIRQPAKPAPIHYCKIKFRSSMPGKTTDPSTPLSETPEKPSTGERRFPRIALPKGMWVAWYGAAQHQISRVGTLSMGGIFICLPNPPPVGTKLKLAFEVPGGEIQTEAIVRNIDPGNGMGTEFTRLNAKDRVLLQRLMNRLLR
jgi:hypothetical protein